jgi:hypothetical protein
MPGFLGLPPEDPGSFSVGGKSMAKDPAMEHIKKYHKAMSEAINNLAALFADDKIAETVSPEMKSRAASMYICLMDLGKIASLKNPLHLSVVSKQIQNYLAQVPKEEVTEAEFSEVLKQLNNDVVISDIIGNC